MTDVNKILLEFIIFLLLFNVKLLTSEKRRNIKGRGSISEKKNILFNTEDPSVFSLGHV